MSRVSQPQAMEMAARGVEVAPPTLKASDLDILSLVKEASTNLGGDLIKWLSWERISEEAFLWTMDLGQNLAQPNENGVKIVDRLETTASKLYGLQLVLPGALGRTIVYDKRLRWIGTTEAMILKHHGVTYAVEVFCEMFAKSRYKDNEAIITAVKARIRPVLSKIVDSLHLHTVNMGYGIQPLPAILEALPKHYLADSSLADVILAVGKAESDVLVELNCYIPEIVEWIFHHWSGKLTITLNNKIEYERQLGEYQHHLVIFIQNSCTAADDCHDAGHVRQFKIYQRAGSSSEFVEQKAGFTDPGIGVRNDSSYRTELYDIRNPFKTRHCDLNMKEKKVSERIAQEIVRQIVDLPVSPGRLSVSLNVEKGSTTKFRWWLKKTPTILQKNLGAFDGRSNSELIDLVKCRESRSCSSDHQPKKGPPRNEDNIMDFDVETDGGREEAPQYTPLQIGKWYPPIYSGLQLVFERCECGCSERALDECLAGELDTGCLLGVMFAQISLQIAHAMGEAGGAKDVSNLHGLRTAVTLSEAAAQFLGVLADKARILWDDWFRLVSSVITGVPYDIANEDTFNAGGGIILWIAGCMTIAPRWLSLDAEIKLSGSWGVEEHQGSLWGLPAETAVIESQYSSSATSTGLPDVVVVESGHDDEDIHIETAVFANTGDLYRFVSMVRTKSVLRVMNPLDVYRGAMLAERYSCSHDQASPCSVRPWSINQILLGWNSHKLPEGSGPHIAFSGNDNVKHNVALAFSVGNCIIQEGRCCLNCLRAKALGSDRVGILRSEGVQNKLLRFK